MLSCCSMIAVVEEIDARDLCETERTSRSLRSCLEWRYRYRARRCLGSRKVPERIEILNEGRKSGIRSAFVRTKQGKLSEMKVQMREGTGRLAQSSQLLCLFTLGRSVRWGLPVLTREGGRRKKKLGCICVGTGSLPERRSDLQKGETKTDASRPSSRTE